MIPLLCRLIVLDEQLAHIWDGSGGGGGSGRIVLKQKNIKYCWKMLKSLQRTKSTGA